MITSISRQRSNCPVCLSEDLCAPLDLHKNIKFPALPNCSSEEFEKDVFSDFTIGMCNSCGLITLLNYIDPLFLYSTFHSDGIGKAWDAHYDKFCNLILRHYRGGDVLEVGAGQGKLMRKMLQHYTGNVSVIDPLYSGPEENVSVKRSFLKPETTSNWKEKFEIVLSSHTLEHFIDFRDYFQAAWNCLEKDGYLFTSIPNQEFNFVKGHGNQLSFEHPSLCTTSHWTYLHNRYGFKIKEINFFRDHSIQMAAQKTNAPLEYHLDFRELSRKMLEEYTTNLQNKIVYIRQCAKKDRQNWLFGASGHSQPLFAYGLDESIFEGVLDNSLIKQNKRFYGTHLICKKPEDIVPNKKNLRIFLNLGNYNNEVHDQLKILNSDVEVLLL